MLYYMKLREEIHPSCYKGLITYSVSYALYWLGDGLFGKLVNPSGVGVNDFWMGRRSL